MQSQSKLQQAPQNRPPWHCRPSKQRHCSFIISRAAAGQDQPSIVFSQQQGDVSEKVEFPLTVPMLPFPVEEVFLPGSVKVLHLFEARYLSLLEEVLSSPSSNKLFAHVVVEQLGDLVGSKASGFPGAFVGDTFVLLMGTLVRVLEVKSLKVGALVRIQAEARVAVTQVTQTTPFLRGVVTALPDDALVDQQQVQQQVQQLLHTMQDLQNLTMKFKSKQTAALQQAMYWWEKDPVVPVAAMPHGITGSSGSNSWSDAAAAAAAAASSSESRDVLESSSRSSRRSRTDSLSCSSSGSEGGSEGGSGSSEGGSSEGGSSEGGSGSSGSSQQSAYSLEQASRLSFAALQAVPEASPKDQLKLLRCCVNAMETRDTCTRLGMVQQHMDESCKLLAAKCALKSLQLPST